MYPLKFKPQLKERLWGGDRLKKAFGKRSNDAAPLGESWEISGVQGDLSVVKNGQLAGNNIQELAEIYLDELLGEKVFAQFYEEFPLLVKLIDARQRLSIQVHPDDKLAAERHHAYGKTELWYIMEADPGAVIWLGFKKTVTRDEYMHHLEHGTVDELLNRIEVHPGETYYIPTGTVHALGEGIMVAEIQQTSDITYRIFDWNRTDASGHPRQLHTDLALSAIDFSRRDDLRCMPTPSGEGVELLKKCEYFTVNRITGDGVVSRQLLTRDSFTIYLCLAGSFQVSDGEVEESLKKGETVLIAASTPEVTLTGKFTALEIYL